MSTHAQGESGGLALGSDGSIYRSGNTDGNLGGTNNGSTDAFLAEFDPITHTPRWILQIGGPGVDTGAKVCVDQTSGMIYIAGSTGSGLYGNNLGDMDGFLVQVPEPGTLSLLGLAGLAVLRRRS